MKNEGREEIKNAKVVKKKRKMKKSLREVSLSTRSFFSGTGHF